MNSITLDGLVGSGELWLDLVRIICGSSLNRTLSYLCDLMCHTAPYTSQLEVHHITFVDIQYRGLEGCKDKNFTFFRSEVIDFLNKSYTEYDVMICSDGIEHLNYFDGGALIALMEQKSKKQIIFTPLGEHAITKDKHPDSHKSGWRPDDFPGWNAIVLPNFHPKLQCGAFFAYRCNNETEKERIYNEIKSKYVITGTVSTS